MNKKHYIKPVCNIAVFNMQVILHQLSQPRILTNAADVDASQVGLTGIYTNNDASGTVTFARDNGGIDWDF